MENSYIDEREKDIQKLCEGIKQMNVNPTGDYGSGAECPFCRKGCRWDADSVMDIEHEQNCIVLIAYDLSMF